MRPTSPSYQPLPLNPWGGFVGRRRISDSPYVESVWEGTASRNDVHLTAADGTIDLTFQIRQGTSCMLLSGPTSKARPAAFAAGDEVLAIRLRPGVHLPFTYGTKLTDVDTFLSSAGKCYFWLHGSVVAFPDFNNVETFIEYLVRKNLLQRDIVVEDVLKQRSRGLSLRTIQRHFLATTGLTMNYLRQIRRAEQARNLLASGHTLASIAYEMGYSNPGHMTGAFKHFFGRTPSALRALVTQ